MPTHDPHDADVPDQAVRALQAASRRAIEAGRVRVAVQNDRLVRIGPDGVTVLEELSPRRTVAVRRTGTTPDP